MKTTFVLLSAVAGALAQSTDAEVVSDNPPGARYNALFDSGLFIVGRVLAGSDAFGMGTTFHVSLSGLPEETGPFKYHIHEDPVPEGGDCAGTGGHLDPYGRTDDPPCDDDQPESCEVGDLSGKHGELDGSSADQSLHDLYTSLNVDSAAFIGNRSVVIHNAAGDRIACANFEEIPAEEAVDPSPSETDGEETPSETAGEETPSETAGEETPSETDSETPVEETPEVTETPDVDFEDDDECEAEEPESTSEASAESPTAEAPEESTAESTASETAEEPPAETTAAEEEAPAETTAPEEEAPADP